VTGFGGWITCPVCSRQWRVTGRRERVVRAVLTRRLREHLVRSHEGMVA
jgi:hypothetical protein